MAKVLISDKLSAQAADVFRRRGIEVDVKPGMSPDELAACIHEYDGLAIRSATKVTPEILAKADKLRVVGRAGIGVDNVNIAAASEKGVVVMNTPFGNTITTAEHAVAMMMAIARQIPAANISTKAGKWEKSRFMGVELTGKTLGVIGVGNIGSIVVERARGLKMRVLAYDPFLSEDRALDMGIEKVELDTLYSRSDFITLHVPLVEATRNLIDATAIAKMKKGVRLINCARGGLIVEKDLKDALDTGQVAGVALDVFEKEPAKEHALFDYDEAVVCTPHLGASTEEAQENVAVQVAEQISDYLLSGAITNALNVASVSAEEAPKLKPYMLLAEQLGAFAGQLTQTGLKRIEIEFQGQVTELNTKPLVAAALTGVLKPMLESVNMVSAPVIAKERDIEVREVRAERCEDYQTLITLTLTSETQTRSVAGTLFAGTKPRFVNIKGIDIEAEMSPIMLYFANEDKPGVIGQLATAMGDAGVNIGTFHLGRSAQGEDAIALVSVDETLTGAVMEKLQSVEYVRQVTQLTF